MTNTFTPSLRLLSVILFAGLKASSLPSSPLFFFESPTEPGVFAIHSPELSATFARGEVHYGKQGKVLTMRFAGGSQAAPTGELVRAGTLNFIAGSEKADWHLDQSMYGRLRYRELFRGVDLLYQGSGEWVKSEYWVRAGVDAGEIIWDYPGADELKVGKAGTLRIRVDETWFEERIPDAYELDHAGRHIPRKVVYRVNRDRTVGFTVTGRNLRHPLVIDPVITFSTFVGGRLAEAATAVAIDPAGNIITAGWTESKDFPVLGARYSSSSGGVDAFVMKWSPNGQQILWATYLGGTGDDRATSVTTDNAGNVIVGGWTQSVNFPANGAQSTFGGVRDGFVVKLNSAGNAIIFATYIGGLASDAVNAVKTDANNIIYAAGETASSDLLTTSGAYQSSSNGGNDGFLAIYQPDGTRTGTTYFGGSNEDRILALALDSAGAIFLGGTTSSPDFPLNNALQATIKGGQTGFVSKLSPGGQALAFSTFLGGSHGTSVNPEQVTALAVDPAGNIVATGVTSSGDFPVSSSPSQATFGGGPQDGFVVKLNGGGAGVLFATYLGGKGIDTLTGVAVDAAGGIHVTGSTTSRNLAVTNAIPGTSYKASYDGFYGRLRADGGSFDTLTYFGGTGADQATSIAVDASSFAYIAGQTLSADFPVKNAYSAYNTGTNGGFLLRLNDVPVAVSVTPATASGFTGNLQFIFADNNSAADIQTVQVLINTNSASANAACSFVFAPSSGVVTFLGDNGGLGGSGSIGSAAVLQNSQCRLPLSPMTSSVNGNQLSLQVSIQFLTAFSGAKQMFAKATDQSSASAGYANLGTFTVGNPNQVPAIVSTPQISGNGYIANYTVVATDGNGYADITQVLLLANASLNGANACYFSIDVPGRTLSLASDSASTFSTISLGTSATASNSTCTLAGSDITLTGSGNNLSIGVRMTFQSSQSGVKTLYAYAVDQARTGSNWVQVGTWALVANQPPQVVSMSATPTAGSSATFTFRLSDLNGFADLTATLVVVNAALDGSNACYFFFDRATQRVNLVQSNGSFAGTAIGTGSVSNSACTLNAAAATIGGSGNTLTYTVPITFSSGYRGVKNVYLYAIDTAQASSGWINAGTFTVQ